MLARFLPPVFQDALGKSSMHDHVLRACFIRLSEGTSPVPLDPAQKSFDFWGGRSASIVGYRQLITPATWTPGGLPGRPPPQNAHERAVEAVCRIVVLRKAG